jgi:hypothetical protein
MNDQFVLSSARLGGIRQTAEFGICTGEVRKTRAACYAKPRKIDTHTFAHRPNLRLAVSLVAGLESNGLPKSFCIRLCAAKPKAQIKKPATDLVAGF